MSPGQVSVREPRSLGRRHAHRHRGHRRCGVALDYTPCVNLFEDPRRKGGVERMAAAVRDQVADHRVADQREIADHVENLVADELVFEPQSVVQDTPLPEDDGVVERAAHPPPPPPPHLPFLHEPPPPPPPPLLPPPP